MSITDEVQLEDALSRPTRADVEAFGRLPGDIVILGVSGKMGPSLARLAKRASDAANRPRRIVGVARFSSPAAQAQLENWGIETIQADLLDRTAVSRLPDAPNVIFMVGQKFGTSGNQPLTWAINTMAPVLAAERYRDSNIVAFSTGNVYPLTDVDSGGPTEQDPVAPVGEYAQSALGRERLFQHLSENNQTPTAILRLNYAVELRYGVLRDIAEKVFNRRPIDLAMGHVNVIWQRDANSIALRMLEYCVSPALVLNVTGAETLSVRDLAIKFGEVFEIPPEFTGTEEQTALLSNASRCASLFGSPEADLDQMIELIGQWVLQGGAALGKPTHFEERTGSF